MARMRRRVVRCFGIGGWVARVRVRGALELAAALCACSERDTRNVGVRRIPTGGGDGC